MIRFKNSDYQTPYIDLLPSLSSDEYKALKNDIIERDSVLIAIVIDDDGNIIDGHNRLKIASEFNILDVSFDIRPNLSEDEKRQLAIDLNLHRRHLTKEQRREWSIKLREDGNSTRQIAEKLGTSQRTVSRDIASGEAIASPQKVTGKDGKQYPAKKKKTSIIAKDNREAQKALNNLENIDTDNLPNKRMDAKRTGRITREIQNEKKRQDSKTLPAYKGNADIRYGDFRETLKDVNNIDLIFTDPPYGKKYLELWSDLATFASQVLKPGKILIAYAGQYHLLEIMNRLQEKLNYVWISSLKTSGTAKNISYQRKIYNGAKLFLFFSNEEYEPIEWFEDFLDGDNPPKNTHGWEQGLGEASYYIDKLTNGNDIVLDPFMGSGTTIHASLQLGRNVIGCDVDLSHYKNTIERVNNWEILKEVDTEI